MKPLSIHQLTAIQEEPDSVKTDGVLITLKLITSYLCYRGLVSRIVRGTTEGGGLTPQAAHLGCGYGRRVSTQRGDSA